MAFRKGGENLLGLLLKETASWNDVSKTRRVQAILDPTNFGDRPPSTITSATAVNRSGPVEVTGVETPPQLVVTATITGRTEDAVNRRQAALLRRLSITEQDGAMVVREGRRPWRMLAKRLYPHVEISLSVPQQETDLQLHTNDSPVTVKGVAFAPESKVGSKSGSVTIEDSGGNPNIETTSGAVRLEKLTGDATVNIADGTLTGVEVSGATTVKGSQVNVSYWNSDGSLRIESDNGANVVNGYLPPEEGHKDPVPTDNDKKLAVTVRARGTGARTGATTVTHMDATLYVASRGPVRVEESLLRNSTVNGKGNHIVMEDVAFIGTTVVSNTGGGGVSIVTSDKDPLHVVATSVSGDVELEKSPDIAVLHPKPDVPIAGSVVANIGTPKAHLDEVVVSTDRGSIYVATGNKAA